MYTDDLVNPILIQPAFADECTKLKIVTGYTDTECIYRHLITLTDLDNSSRISVEMILGMTDGNGLSEKKHKDINRLIQRIKTNSKMPNFTCRYKFQGTDIHSKVYVWLKENNPCKAFCGSANYSMNAFYRRRECMTDCDSQEAESYFDSLLVDTVLATDKTVYDKIKFSQHKENEFEIDKYNLENLSWEMFTHEKPIDSCKISLLTADGKKTGSGSGLNWGIRPNGLKRDLDQAYIPYNSKDKKENFFPLKKNKTDLNNPLFKVVPKDFEPFFMRIAQQGNKGIHTAESNALLGQFFRYKLNVPSGTFITKEMLEKYGKTYVVFNKYKNNIYTLEF